MVWRYISYSFCIFISFTHGDAKAIGSSFKVDETIKGVDIIFESSPGATATRKVRSNSEFSKSEILATGPGGLCQISSSFHHSTIRLGSNTILHWKNDSSWHLLDGSILVCKESKDPLTLFSVKGSATILGKCSFIAEATTNGGYKFICLSGQPDLRTDNGNTQIKAGRLVLVLGETNALGNAYDIDLLLLLKSSLLINAFEEPPATMKKIGLAVYSQQLKLKNKYNALIGDAPTDKNLQMWVLGKSGQEKESD